MMPRDSGYPRKVSDGEARLAPPASGDTTRDRKRTVYIRDGDVFLYDFSTDKVRQLTKTNDPEQDPHFTQDERRVAFTRAGNLYVLNLSSGSIEQMTDIKAGPLSPDNKPPAGSSQEFLQKQEKELLAAVRDRSRQKDAEEAKKKRENPRKPFELGDKQVVDHLELCPNEKCVIALIKENPKGDKPDNVPNYVTES